MKFFNGPTGVYYDSESDLIYELQRTAIETINMETGELKRVYRMYDERWPEGLETLLVESEYSVKIGNI
jgi:hypothetical protein